MNFNLLSRYFNQSASKEDKEKMHRWTMGNPSRQAELDNFQKLWDESGNLKSFEGIDTETDWAMVRQRIGSPYKLRHQPISFMYYLPRIAAFVLLAFGLSLGLVSIYQTVARHASAYASFESLDQVKTIALPDGSSVTLNINSALRYDKSFNRESRDIILQGEAYFEAQYNPELPFRVFTGNSVVEVTGTRFSIFEDTSFVRVMVLSGSVSFQSSENPDIATIVSKDESGFIFRNNKMEKYHQLNLNNISWKTGQLVFHKTPVESALQDIADHFHKDLRVEASIVDSLTAQFTEQSLDDILEELRLITSLTINESGNIIVVKQ